MSYRIRKFWSNPHHRYYAFSLLLFAFIGILDATPFALLDLLIYLYIGFSSVAIFQAGRDSVVYDEIERDSDRS